MVSDCGVGINLFNKKPPVKNKKPPAELGAKKKM
jgi:hypothetical protein